MSDAHHEYLDLCAGYALDGLSEDDRKKLDTHLESGCATCEAALRDFTEATALLAGLPEPVVPPASLKAKVMEAVRAEAAREGAEARGERPSPKPDIRLVPASRPPNRLTWGLAIAAGLLAVFGVVSWERTVRIGSELTSAQKQIDSLAAQLEDTTAELIDVRNTLTSEQHWANVMLSQGVKVVILSPTGKAKDGLEGTAYYNPKTGEARLVFYAVSKTRERDFEVWAIGSEGPVSLGLLVPDPAGVAEVRVPNLAAAPGLSAFAVSREPVGGSSNPRAPSGPVVTLGAIL